MKQVVPSTIDGKLTSHFSEAIRVGDLIFVAGQVAADDELNIVGRGDVVRQAGFIFERMQRILKEVGGTLENIVWIQFFVRNMEDRVKITPVRKKFFGDYRPASTLVEVSKLALEDALLEVNAIAMLEK
ncbi:MAG: RidA family protein [Acidobacteria bacterium]|nr:MAG: RidA family protein [Acidobacteriota bacterium]